MITKRYYLTTPARENLWHYVCDPAHPSTTLDVGLIEVDREEIRVDMFGAYVTRFLLPNYKV